MSLSKNALTFVAPLAPHILIAILGMAVCFMIACGASTRDADAEDADDDGSSGEAECSRADGYRAADRFGAYACSGDRRSFGDRQASNKGYGSAGPRPYGYGR